jgi:2-haloacid dehalogenase
MMSASTLEILRREIRCLVFDQYGTVVDMQSGLTEAVTPFLEAKGFKGRPHQFVTWWRRTHFEDSMIDALCDRGHTPYRQIGHRAVSLVMQRSGIEFGPEDVEWLVERIVELTPFPDVVVALERLRRRGYRLAILSNGDRDMLEAARPHIGFPFDATLSVQDAGYFKPHWRTYAMACERLEVDRSEVLFVANHPFDCVGAKAFGMRSCYVNRRGRAFGESPHQPDLVVEDFERLAEAMAP